MLGTFYFLVSDSQNTATKLNLNSRLTQPYFCSLVASESCHITMRSVLSLPAVCVDHVHYRLIWRTSRRWLLRQCILQDITRGKVNALLCMLQFLSTTFTMVLCFRMCLYEVVCEYHSVPVIDRVWILETNQKQLRISSLRTRDWKHHIFGLAATRQISRKRPRGLFGELCHPCRLRASFFCISS